MPSITILRPISEFPETKQFSDLATAIKRCSIERMKREFTNITVTVPKEISFSIKKGVAHRAVVWHTSFMPSQGAPDKDYLTIRISRHLKKRIEKFAASRGESVTDVVIALATKAVAHVELTPQDYIDIAAAVSKASKTIKSKKHNSKNQHP